MSSISAPIIIAGWFAFILAGVYFLRAFARWKRWQVGPGNHLPGQYAFDFALYMLPLMILLSQR